MSKTLAAFRQFTAAISLRGISKTYQHFRLENIDLEIEPGKVNGLIGPNGAGKSTTLQLWQGSMLLRWERLAWHLYNIDLFGNMLPYKLPYRLLSDSEE